MFDEKHYSVKELASLWGVSADTVRRRFNGEPGILNLKTNYNAMMRIPESVAKRVYNRSTQLQ